MITKPEVERSVRRPAHGAAAAARWRHLGAAAVLILLVFGGMSAPAVAEPAVQVILSSDHSEVQVDRKLLLSVYIGRITTWPDGKPIRVFTLADDNPVHVQFTRQMLGTYPYVLRNAWNKLVYTGTGFAPTTVANEQEMRRRVSETPGAIGYVGTNIAGSANEFFKVSVAAQANGARQ
jgi:ABC-type phosphate transport system substrate-binding protein